MTGVTKPGVLIVEDNVNTCRWLRKLLGLCGYDVESATTLQDAVAMILGEPTCIILDLDLPDGSGVEVLRYVRERHLSSRVAIVTGTEDLASLGNAVMLHPDALFTKPVDPTELIAWVQSTCLFTLEHSPATILPGEERS